MAFYFTADAQTIVEPIGKYLPIATGSTVLSGGSATVTVPSAFVVKSAFCSSQRATRPDAARHPAIPSRLPARARIVWTGSRTFNRKRKDRNKPAPLGTIYCAGGAYKGHKR